jgi:hypothetical protein
MARLQSLGITPDDPPFTHVFAQAQALTQSGLAVLEAAGVAPSGTGQSPTNVDISASALPDRLRALLDAYVACAHSAANARRPAWLNAPVYESMRALTLEAPALSSTEPGRMMLALARPDRALIAVHAYVRWSSEALEGTDRRLFQRVVSDLLPPMPQDAPKAGVEPEPVMGNTTPEAMMAIAKRIAGRLAESRGNSSGYNKDPSHGAPLAFVGCILAEPNTEPALTIVTHVAPAQQGNNEHAV